MTTRSSIGERSVRESRAAPGFSSAIRVVRSRKLSDGYKAFLALSPRRFRCSFVNEELLNE